MVKVHLIGNLVIYIPYQNLVVIIVFLKIIDQLVYYQLWLVFQKKHYPTELLPFVLKIISSSLGINCAFQPNKPTEDILGCLAQDVCINFQNESMTEVSFLDLQSAYDTVWRNGLLYKLKEKYNMDGNFINFLKSYFSDRWNRHLL